MGESSKLQLMVLGADADVSGWLEALGSKEGWEVISGETDRKDIDVIVLGSDGDVNADWLAAFKEKQTECLVLASRERVSDDEAWQQVGSVVDDLFDSRRELIERIPFITKRLNVRDARRQQFEAIFEHAVDAIIIIDRNGRIQRFNQAAQEVFGYPWEAVQGQNVSMLMPNTYARNHDRYIGNYLRTGMRKVMGIGREVEGLRKNGEVFPMELALSEFESEGELFFAGFVRDISERRKLENAVLKTSEHERRRVGQDLHDGLGQMLTGISLISGNLARRLALEDHHMAEDLAEVTELVRDADRMSRNIARGLVPVELDGEGLATAIEILCQNAQKFFSVECVFGEEGGPYTSDSGAASNLYRIAQECISNAVKHGRATRIDVSLRKKGEKTILQIADNGVGFPETLSEERGMGVDIMGYRARVINARLSIEHREEGGTIITCVLSSAHS